MTTLSDRETDDLRARIRAAMQAEGIGPYDVASRWERRVRVREFVAKHLEREGIILGPRAAAKLVADLAEEPTDAERAFRVLAQMPYMGGRLVYPPQDKRPTMDEVIKNLETLRDVLQHVGEREREHEAELVEIRSDMAAVGRILRRIMGGMPGEEVRVNIYHDRVNGTYTASVEGALDKHVQVFLGDDEDSEKIYERSVGGDA